MVTTASYREAGGSSDYRHRAVVHPQPLLEGTDGEKDLRRLGRQTGYHSMDTWGALTFAIPPDKTWL